MVNRGEEKVRVHMNVVPRSTGNTNSGTTRLVARCVSNFSSPVRCQYDERLLKLK